MELFVDDGEVVVVVVAVSVSVSVLATVDGHK
jgi:hypothetical protein